MKLRYFLDPRHVKVEHVTISGHEARANSFFIISTRYNRFVLVEGVLHNSCARAMFV